MQIYELLSVGMVILLGLLGGKLFHRIKIPRVTGYMLTGLIFGPSVLGLINSSTLSDIHMINEIALGLILFAIGGEIELRHLKAMGRKVIFVALAESFGALVLVAAGTLLVTGDIRLAVILGSIAMATAPGVTLLVIREYRARGPLTDTLLTVVAINNALCLILFRVFFLLSTSVDSDPFWIIPVALFKELAISAVIGGIIAAMTTFWEQKIDDLSELLLVIIGGLLLSIGLAKTLDVSPLMVCLIYGTITNNLSMMHRLVYAELRQIEMPFYIAFFVLSGASLHLGALADLGLLGIVYVVSRPIGKWLGVYFVGKKNSIEPAVTANLGLALLPQAGVAIGMVLTLQEADPAMGQIVGAVVLSSVVVYESVGPFLTRLALARAKEIHLQE